MHDVTYFPFVSLRLFIVCHPSPPPIYALKDVFGRFGNLIDIYMLNGKTFGYAKYSSKDSADKAIVVSTGNASGRKGSNFKRSLFTSSNES